MVEISQQLEFGWCNVCVCVCVMLGSKWGLRAASVRGAACGDAEGGLPKKYDTHWLYLVRSMEDESVVVLQMNCGRVR